ncbi:cytochrome P450 21 [Durotheca rogersii]|uniref:cytochrome P450 21 n=1 Tax=Durotheca rogersii TaxID=419775 RepID=UPI00221E419E|nr:cytochrome P450 21 [Durotheca rogersii]KAI5864710.1 cytochrome P450 21 [Durotheca rogersii]
MGYPLPYSLGISLWLALMCVVAYVIRFSLRSLPDKNYPPGPPCRPFIGNSSYFSSPMPFLDFTEMRKTYGNIIGLKSGSRNLVVLNTAKLVDELLEKRWSIYSSRPADDIVVEYVLRDSQHIVSMPYDGYLKQWRAATRYLLGYQQVEQMLPRQEASAAHLMLRLAESPGNAAEHFQTWSLFVPMLAICGDSTARNDSEIKDTFFKNQQDWMTILIPGSTSAAEHVPILKYVPEFFAKWKRAAESVRRNQRKFYYMMLDSARRELAENPASCSPSSQKRESLGAKLLRQQQQDGKGKFNDDQLAYLMGTLLDASVDTTFSTVKTLLLALAAYPNCLEQAQAEIDALRGSDYPPQSEDLGKLPFLRACLLEVMRWRPAVPILVSRRLDADDIVDGYHLPKGTVVFGNTWAIQQDPEHYENPDVFNPDRFLSNPYGTKTSADEAKVQGRKPIYIFGVGRRRCPGDVFAMNTTLITLAKLLWAFDITPTGKVDLDMRTGFRVGLVMIPNNFNVSFAPRSDKHREALSDDFQRLSHLLE